MLARELAFPGGLALLAIACSGKSSTMAKGSGGAAPAGGYSASGGVVGSGGQPGSGGTTATGGMVATGGTTAEPQTGGTVATGGSFTMGGATSRVSSTGGASARGGASVTGGTTSTGGAMSTGGASARGGATSTGGTYASGGSTGAATQLDRYVRTQGPITLGGISNASGIAWKPETDTFFIVANITNVIYEYTADFKTRLRTISLDNGATDAEDVVYLGANRFAVADEQNQVYVVSIPDGATSANVGAADVEHYVVTAPPATTNRGFEGVAFRPDVGAAGQLVVCQEGGVSGTPIRVLFFDRRTNAGTSSYTDGTLTVREPWNALSKLGSVATDLASVYFEASSSTLLVLGQESSRLLRVALDTGNILDQRDLSGSPQYEGITLASGGRLVLVSEPNYVEIYQAN